MPSNIENKARVVDLPTVAALAASLTDTPPQRLRQRDTFFRYSTGRLRLRELGAGQSELIFYHRADVTGAKQSDYETTPVADAAALKTVLREALGETATVEKTRVPYLVGQTRVHLDTVVGLGTFLELEVVLRPDQSPSEGYEFAADLMRRLGIGGSDLVATADADMLTESVFGSHAATSEMVWGGGNDHDRGSTGIEGV